MPTFYESSVLSYALASGTRRLPPSDALGEIGQVLGLDAADELNDALVALLIGPDVPTNAIDVVEGEPVQFAPAGFGLRFRTQHEDGQPVLMRFFRIKESWLDSLLSLVGAALALYAGSSSGAGVASVRVARNVWSNLVTLRRPQDALQLDTYEALLVALAHSRHRSLGAGVSVHDVHRHSSNGTIERTLSGLKQLHTLKLAEVAAWAGSSLNYEELENHWSASF